MIEDTEKLRLIKLPEKNRSLNKSFAILAYFFLILSLAVLLLNDLIRSQVYAAPIPTNLRVVMSTASNNALTVSWSQSSGPVTGYWLSRSGNVIKINTTSINVNYVDSGLSAGQVYVYKVASSDASSVSNWSIKASGVTKNAGNYTKPHAPFTDNTNMCQACHSIHMTPTPFKTLYKRYTNLSSAFSTAESSSGQSLPGAEICFNCHDGSGASYNAKQYYDQPTSAAVPWPGHMTRRASTTAPEASFGGWKYIQGLPAGSRLPCMVCHDSHVSSKNNWKLLADGLVDYAKSPSGAWGNDTVGPYEILSDATSTGVVDLTNNAYEKCTVCHHDGSRSNGIMRVAGLDLYWPSTNNGTPVGERDVMDHGIKTNCDCHAGASTAQNNVHALGKGGKPSSPQSNCGSCHSDVVNRTMSSGMTSRHYLAADDFQDQPASYSDRCTSKCHNNHGERTPSDSNNLYIDAPTRVGAANYDFTASASQPGLCLSCHQNAQSSNRPGGTSNSTAYISPISPQPYISSAHSYRSESYETLSSRTYKMSCLKCHRDNDQSTTYSKWGPHASANRSLLYLPATQLGGNAGDEERTCLSCHSNSKDQWTGRTMATVAWKISQAFSQQPNLGHASMLLSTTIDRHRVSEGMNKVWMTSGNRHVECQDCHNPHAASQGYNYMASLPGVTASPNITQSLETPSKGSIASSLQGVWGVYPTTNWNSIPTAAYYTASYTPADADGRLFYTSSATKQVYICLKCHSSYAYGTKSVDRPIIPSGAPLGAFAGIENPIDYNSKQTDILADFNPNNIGYHPIFTIGKNQPPVNATTAWTSDPFRLLTSSYAAQGLDHAFVPPWGTKSLVTCSDCHSHSSSSYSRGYYTSAPSIVNAWDFPRGPHGSARRWLLRSLDKSIRYQRVNGWYDYNVSVTETSRHFCLNCHRADVYVGGGASAPAKMSRIPHMPPSNHSRPADPTWNWWGITCMTCHGGAEMGLMHGTGGAPADTGNIASSPPRGRRLIFGAAWDAYTVSTSQVLLCSTKSSTDKVSNCNQHTTGTSASRASYNY